MQELHDQVDISIDVAEENAHFDRESWARLFASNY